jgi:hypothetical protein
VNKSNVVQIAWTEKEDEILREFYPNRHIPVSAIAACFKGRSVDSVTGRATRLGLVRPVGCEIDEEALKSLRQMGDMLEKYPIENI